MILYSRGYVLRWPFPRGAEAIQATSDEQARTVATEREALKGVPVVAIEVWAGGELQRRVERDEKSADR